MTDEASMSCRYCDGEVTVVAMTAEGSWATCPCGRTTLTAHPGRPVIGQEHPAPITDRDPGDEQP